MTRHHVAQRARQPEDEAPTGTALRPVIVGALACMLALASAITGCAPGRRITVGPPPRGGEPAVTIAVQVETSRGDHTILRLPLEEYVAGCVDAELGHVALDAAAASRMRRVQAIVCRTYALANLGRHRAEGFDLCDSTHCQRYRRLPPESLAAQLATAAARETAGLVITFGGAPIQALFHASCGGRTTRAEDVWGGQPLPYLVSVRDPSCERQAGWQYRIGTDGLGRLLRADPRTDIGTRLDRIEVARHDQTGRAAEVLLIGAATRKVLGDVFRAVVSQGLGGPALRSTWFSVRQSGGEIIFDGRGHGHGVGLCQAGAMARARDGQSEVEILAHYYPGTRLERIDPHR